MSRRLRLILLALCSSVLLPCSGALAAEHGSACAGSPMTAQFVEFSAPGATLRWRLTVDAAGDAALRGVLIQQRSRRPLRWVARGPAEIVCADRDGDGRAGLVQIASGVRDAASGRRARVVLAAQSGEIAVSGTYAVSVSVNASGMIGDIRTVISAEAAFPSGQPLKP
jgi:hypothetical protein